ncbi:MAG: hypothetical protein K8R69_12070, partial [Deltaproteobacteria bacterium]|nr:hypothetical protein [Deltaproteobacteria bacterium]
MSNLIVVYDGLTLPPQACADEPASSKAASSSAPSTDNCSIVLPLALDDKKEAAHAIRFDRQKDRFVLSPSNSADDLTWVGQQGNLPSILDILRISGASFLAQKTVGDLPSLKIKLMTFQYAVSGKAVLPQTDSAVPNLVPGDKEIANSLGV